MSISKTARPLLGLLAVGLAAGCSDVPTRPEPGLPPLGGPSLLTAPLDGVRFSEIHYDNAGTDAGEAIEIVGPAGTDLTGWSIVLYNGSNSLAYGTTPLSGALPATCGGEGVLVVEYPSNGIQNGGPDGFALVDASGAPVEFLSYEGTLTAADGPAAGVASTDIGVAETSSTPAGESLQRDASGAWQGPQASSFGACNDVEPPPPPPATNDLVIHEVLADPSAVTDANGEWVEIHNRGATAVDLEGWQIVSNNDDAHTIASSVVVPAGGYAVLARNGDPAANGGVDAAYAYGSLNLANGSDWVALRDDAGATVDSVAWSASAPAGASRGVVDPAADNTDVGGANWATATAAFGAGDLGTPGAANDGAPPPPPPSDAPIVIHELLGDPLAASGGASWGEWFEVHNTGTEPVNLRGWTLASGGQPVHVVAEDVVVPAGGYAVLGRGDDPARNGGVELDYNYFTGGTTIWLDNADWLALRDAAGASVDSVAWTSLPRGITRAVRDPAQANLDVDGANWGYSTVRFGDGDFGTPDAANGELSDTPPSHGEPGVPVRVTLSRFDADYWVPAGYQKPLFASVVDGSSTPVDAPLAWTSSDESVATVDALGYVTGVSTGTVTITATTPNGVRGSRSFEVRPGELPTSAVYRDHVEFGVPEDGTPADDFLIEKEQFVLSYSETRGGPNWVAWNLNATHFGSEDRCECFTPDPDLPAGVYRVTDFDYRNSGYSRGHMTMSANRTTTGVENAATFLMTNILPQSNNNNGGPWLDFEIFLNDLAEDSGREVYVVAGGEYSASPETLKGEGRVQVPEFTWKVAVVLDAGEGLESVDSWDDLEVYAIRTPNDSVGARDIRDDDWTEHATTVDEIEARTGYDFLDLLPDVVEAVVESGDRAPVAAVDGPYTVPEGAALRLSGEGSSDPDGDALTYHWDFGDGTTGTGAAPEHVYRDDGNYAITLTVTDPFGAASTATTSAMVVNVAPAVGEIPDATLLPGETYGFSGTATDPGADDVLIGLVDWGDGSPVQALEISGRDFALEHRYAKAGTFTLRVTVKDDEGDLSTSAATVTVLSHGQAVDRLVDLLAGMVDGQDAKWLLDKLGLARKLAEKGNLVAAANQVKQAAARVAQLAGSGELSGEEAELLEAELRRLLRSVQG